MGGGGEESGEACPIDCIGHKEHPVQSLSLYLFITLGVCGVASVYSCLPWFQKDARVDNSPLGVCEHVLDVWYP